MQAFHVLYCYFFTWYSYSLSDYIIIKLEENWFLQASEENMFLNCHQDVNIDGYFMDCMNFYFAFLASLF